MTSHSDADATDDTPAAVAGTVATVGGGINDGAIAAVGDGAVATATVTNHDDETIATDGKKVSSSYRQDAGIQTQGQQARSKRCRRRQTLVTTTAVSPPPSMDDWIPASCRNDKP